MNTKEILLPSISKITHELEEAVNINVKKNLKQILDLIADEYHLSKNELYQKYLSDVSLNNVKNNVPSDNRCTYICKTGKKQQCSRKKKNGGLYCGLHGCGELVPRDPSIVASPEPVPSV